MKPEEKVVELLKKHQLKLTTIESVSYTHLDVYKRQMMVCAGASEQAVSQWVSTFAEKGLGISKAAGDLAGPMAFALCMGLSRMFYGCLLYTSLKVTFSDCQFLNFMII